MNNFRLFVLLAGSAMALCGSGPSSAQDVQTTGAIHPTLGRCELTPETTAALTTAVAASKLVDVVGCPGRKTASFELLGQTTETYEFIDGQRRLQVTTRNGKVVSSLLRKY